MSKDKYVSILVILQKADSYSDKAFAKKLGISRQTWQGIRSGHIPISNDIIALTVKPFPNLWYLAAVAILDEPNKYIWNLMDGHLTSFLNKFLTLYKKLSKKGGDKKCSEKSS